MATLNPSASTKAGPSTSTFLPEVSYVTLSAIEERIYQVAVETMHTICEQFSRNRASGDKEALSRGCWYPNEYYKALNKYETENPPKQDQPSRLEYLKNRGAFYHGYLDHKIFIQEEDNDALLGKKFMSFAIRDVEPPILPTDALNAALNGLSFIGCGEAIELAYWEALRQELGNDKFNYLFLAKSKTPFWVSSNNKKNPINLLLRPIKSPRCLKGRMYFVQSGAKIHELTPGLCFSSYEIKHILGESNGFNLMAQESSEKKESVHFLGFGLNPNGETLEGVTQCLLGELNAPPVGEEILPEAVTQFAEQIPLGGKSYGYSRFAKDMGIARIALADSLKDLKISLQQFKKEGGGEMFPNGAEFDLERIALLKQASNEEAAKLMQIWGSLKSNITHRNL